MLQISVDVNESVVSELVNRRVLIAVDQEIDFAIRNTTSKHIGPYVRGQIEAVLESDEFQEMMQKYVDEQIAKQLSGDALYKLFMNKVFKAAIHSEAGKASHAKKREST